jgi:16S rRNA (guanine527-N7)-methyltransferase
MSVQQEFEALLAKHPAKWTEQARSRMSLFYKLVLEENEIQNLTRITAPKDFFEKNVLDVVALLDLNWVDYPALDLGSGMGVPGVIAAILSGETWILAESEKKKAEFLQKVVCELGLAGQVTVFSGRGEDFLKTQNVKTVVSRAVGPVSRIWGWLKKCSTWNKLVLFKGPGWDEEWKTLPEAEKKKLRLARIQKYQAGADQPERKLVCLERVPRGTSG